MSSDQRINMVAQTDDGLEPIAKKAANYVAGLIAAPGIVALLGLQDVTSFWHLGDLHKVDLWNSKIGYKVEALFPMGAALVAVTPKRDLAEAIAIELMFQAQLERQGARERQ